MELAYASLHQLCAPLLDRLERLPAPQRQAVEIVFGLSSGTAPDRFLVGLGVLSLVSEVAEERPAALRRRRRAVAGSGLGADARVRRSPVTGRAGGARVRSTGTRRGAPARAGPRGARPASTAMPARCWTRRCGSPLDERVRDRILAETRGNPLALLELPRGLTPTQLAGGFGMPDAADLSERIEKSFLRRLETAPGGRATSAARRRGRPGRRSAAAAARLRPPRDRARRRLTRRTDCWRWASA